MKIKYRKKSKRDRKVFNNKRYKLYIFGIFIETNFQCVAKKKMIVWLEFTRVLTIYNDIEKLLFSQVYFILAEDMTCVTHSLIYELLSNKKGETYCKLLEIFNNLCLELSQHSISIDFEIVAIFAVKEAYTYTVYTRIQWKLDNSNVYKSNFR